MSQIYVPLHNHTHGSSLDGFATEEELAVRASEIGAKAVGITDHGECGRHYAFDQYCRSNGVKPIFGTEAYFVDDVDKSRERKDKPSDFDHACLWAYNNEGLRNLWTLSTISYDEKHFYYRPRMDFALLRKHSKGLAVSDGCLLAEVARAVNADDDDRAIRYLTTLADIFGKENVFIELHTWQFIDPSDDRQRSLNAEMTKANQGKLRLAKQLGLKTIAVNDAHYAWKDDHPYHELVWAGLKNKSADTLSDVLSDDGSSLGRGQTAAWVMTDEEIYTYLGMHGIPRSDIAEAIQNTADFADRCDAQIDSHPRFPYLTGDKEKDLTLFEKSIEEGFERKVPKGKEAEYRERVEYEKSVILAKNFHGYFNVVADYMKFAKEPDPLGLRGGIPGKEEAFVGAGRGSGASSLVSYLMDITEINPIRHDLPFERFLSMSRGVDKGKKIYFDDRTILPVKDTDKLSSLSIGDTHNGKTVIDVQDSFVGDFPDIDSDFPSSFAETIIGYLKRRYGFFHVAKVGTNQTSQAKNVFKDLARAYDVPYAVSNAITRAFPDDVGPHYFESKEALESLYRESPGLREHSMILEKVAPRMKKMVGRHRQFGAHASGYIITNESLLGELPMRYKDGELVTQFNLDELNDMGFIKYDILKIKALDVIDDAVRSAIENGKVVRKTVDDVTLYKNIKNVDPDDGWEKVDSFTPEMIYLGATNELDNPDIWAPTREGDSLGIFQMETNAGQRMAKRIKVMDVTDGAIMSAVNRPGMTRGGHADKFIARRDGEEQVTYPHPMLEAVVGETEGFFVFQEQVMRLFSSLAGYTMEEADSVRKIISKMQADKMDGLYREFVAGCKSNPDFVAGVPSRYESIEDCCDDIWEMIKYTVEYAFNMAHCLAGMSRIRLDTGEVISIAKAFKRFESGEKLRVTQMKEDGTIGHGDVKQVMFSGVKEVLTMTLSNGKKIRATEDHKFLTTTGYKKLSEIVKGDVLLSDDENSYAETVLSESMKKTQSKLTFEDRSAHQQNIQKKNPNRTKNWQAASVERAKELRQDPEWVEFHARRTSEGTKEYWDKIEDKKGARDWSGYTFWHSWEEERIEEHKRRVAEKVKEWRNSLSEEELTEWQKSVTEGKRRAGTLNFGRRTVISDGRVCDSLFEAGVAEYLLERGVEFEMHKLVPGTQRFCDFYVNGVYVEADGLNRGKQFFKDRKYGDDVPFLVVTPKDWKCLIDEMLMQHNVKNGLEVVSVERVPLPGRWKKTYGKTYDIEMGDNCPSNFIVDGVVSHNSTSYAYLSGWQSWLKVNFLTEFIKASITYSPDEVAKYSTYAKRRGISVLRPDVNKSKDKFTIEGADIRAPLSLIANVGDRAEKDILDGQPFKDIEDFENRTSNMGAKRMNVYHNLVLSGAFDDMESDRWKLLGEVYTRKGKVVERGHEIVPDISVDISTRAKVAKVEEEIMGISFSFDPMVEVEGNLKSEAYSTQEEVEKFEVWDKFPVYGKVTRIKRHKAKNGEMAWLLLELKDFSEMDVTMFSETWNANKYLFESGDVLLLSIQRSRDYNDNRSYVVKQMINMTDHLSSKEL